MSGLTRFRLSKLLLPLLSIAAACGREPIAPPTVLPEVVAPTSADSARIILQDQIAALEMLLAKDGGLDQFLRDGADPTLIAQRRASAESALVTTRARLATLHQNGASFVPVVVSDYTWAEAPLCILLNFNADNCILDAYSTVDYHGSGTVYTLASSAFHHGTTSFITDNGGSVGNPIEKSNFGLAPEFAATLSFSPADRNCVSADHVVRVVTSHRISASIEEVEVSGSTASSNHSDCQRQYLTVSLSASSIQVAETATITIGHLPAAGCAYNVVSSNAEVARIEHPGADIWAVTGVSAGTVTISAQCPSGVFGATTLTVTGGSCETSGTGTATMRASLIASLCGTQTGSPGGGSAPPPPSGSCRWERWFVVYTDGSWEWLGEWQQNCEDAMIMASLAVEQPKLRLRLLGASSLGNGRSVTVIRDHAPGVAATIAVDTLRASAADLEQAFAAAQLLAAEPERPESGPVDGAVVSEATEAARAKHGPTSRGAKYLAELSKAAEKQSKHFGKGPSLDIEIDVKPLRAKKP